jgi:hypothetical protein
VDGQVRINRGRPGLLPVVQVRGHSLTYRWSQWVPKSGRPLLL